MGNRSESVPPPVVIIVGGEHGTFEGITHHIPAGVPIAHVPGRSSASDFLASVADVDSGQDIELTIAALGLELGLVSRRLRHARNRKELPDSRFWLMYELMRRPGEVVCPRFLMREVWDLPENSDRQPLRQCAHLLRRTISALGSSAQILHSRGGYMLSGGTLRPDSVTKK